MIYGEAQQWLEKQGFTIKDSAVGNVEISPLLSYDGENMDVIRRSRQEAFTLPTYIDKDGSIKEVVAKIKENNNEPAPAKAPEPALASVAAVK